MANHPALRWVSNLRMIGRVAEEAHVLDEMGNEGFQQMLGEGPAGKYGQTAPFAEESDKVIDCEYVVRDDTLRFVVRLSVYSNIATISSRTRASVDNTRPPASSRIERCGRLGVKHRSVWEQQGKPRTCAARR